MSDLCQTPLSFGSLFTRNFLPNTKVFLYSPRDKLTIGYGGFSCIWCQNVHDFRKEILYKDASQLHTFLKDNGYEYLIINKQMDSKYFKSPSRFGEAETEKFLLKRYAEILSYGSFIPAYQVEDRVIVFKLRTS